MGIAATSCVGSTETTVATEPPSPLEVEFSGCAELWAGTICELPDDGKLRLWTKAAPSVELAVRADGAKLAATRSEVQDGAQLRVSVPAGARALSVTVVPDSGTGELAGLSGQMDITIVDGQHHYRFDFELSAPPRP